MLDRLASQRIGRRVLLVKVGRAVALLNKKLTSAVTQKLVDADLNLKGRTAETLEKRRVFLRKESDLLIRSFGVENVAKGDVLKAKGLADIVARLHVSSQ